MLIISWLINMPDMVKERLDRNFGLILHDVARLLRISFDRRVRNMGMTRSQWWVLTHLFREEGLTQTELAELMEIEKPSLGKLLDRLESKQWIRRVADSKDRRVKRIYLTDDVEPLVAKMRSHAADVRHEALAGLSPAQRDQLVDTLLLIKDNLGQTEATAKARSVAEELEG